MKSEQTFEIVVSGQSDDHSETVQGLKQLLKRLGRTFKLRCLTIRCVTGQVTSGITSSITEHKPVPKRKTKEKAPESTETNESQKRDTKQGRD